MRRVLVADLIGDITRLKVQLPQYALKAVQGKKPRQNVPSETVTIFIACLKIVCNVNYLFENSILSNLSHTLVHEVQ